MSHLKERKDKECLNCNAIIYGRFCHVCGQENVEPKETFLHLVRHFIEDVTHFDGKFFDTLRYLILRPGFLAYEYMRGRRNSYLNPIRMYVFTSAIFFLIYFSAKKHESGDAGKTKEKTAHSNDAKKGTPVSSFMDGVADGMTEASEENPSKKDSLAKVTKKQVDTISHKAQTTAKQKYFYNNANDTVKTKTSTAYSKSVKKDVVVEDIKITETKDEEDEPDTVSLAGIRIIKNKDTLNGESVKSKKPFGRFLEGLFKNKEEAAHKLPQVMFVTLPFMALMLQLLYRRSKQFFYVNHIIFIINLYIGVYLLILLGMGIDYLYEISHFRLFKFFSSIVSIGSFFYVYKSLRNFYHQGKFKTFIKCLLLYFLFFLVAVISFLLVAVIMFSLSH